METEREGERGRNAHRDTGSSVFNEGSSTMSVYGNQQVNRPEASLDSSLWLHIYTNYLVIVAITSLPLSLPLPLPVLDSRCLLNCQSPSHATAATHLAASFTSYPKCISTMI